jgi:hypothetical protein
MRERSGGMGCNDVDGELGVQLAAVGVETTQLTHKPGHRRESDAGRRTLLTRTLEPTDEPEPYHTTFV